MQVVSAEASKTKADDVDAARRGSRDGQQAFVDRWLRDLDPRTEPALLFSVVRSCNDRAL